MMTIEFEYRAIKVRKTEAHPIAAGIGYDKRYSHRWNRMVYQEEGRPRQFARIAGRWQQVGWNEIEQVWMY
jgi:hypothetical protein